MVARFTQIDYDRELALVAVVDVAGAVAFVGVARYVTNPGDEAAEFAVVVSDEWQGRGVARVLMERLLECAKRRGLKRIEGTVLRENHNMLKFTTALGFETHPDPEGSQQVIVVKDLV